jgi:hypothetical protein
MYGIHSCLLSGKVKMDNMVQLRPLPFMEYRPENKPFLGEVIDNLCIHIPCYVEDYIPYFVFDHGAIMNEAQIEGYHIVKGETFNESKIDSSINAVCTVVDFRICFLRRQFFKGKPGRDFKLDRAGKPAFYSPEEIGYYKSGELHREGNLPAYLSLWELTWNANGKWHRDDDGPTIINAYRGYSYHKNHDLIRRWDLLGPRKFIEFKDGIGQWEKEE